MRLFRSDIPSESGHVAPSISCQDRTAVTVGNNVNSANATQTEERFVYKTLAEASKDSSNEVAQPYGISLSAAELSDYAEKQKVKEDSGIIKDIIEDNPELYSGFYYKPDKGTLVVQITQDSKELKDKINGKVKHKNKIEYQITKYSKKNIDDAKKQIKEKMPGGSVKALIPDTINNKLIVILDDDGNKDKVFSAVSDQELIHVGGSVKTEEQVADQTDYGTNIPSGAMIAGRFRVENGQTVATVCTAGYYGLDTSDQDILVTSGHCEPLGSSTAWFQPWNTTPTIGDYTFRTTSSNPDGSDGVSDAGYIVLNGHSGNPHVPFDNMVPVVGAYVSDTVGDTIYMRGSQTGALTAGTISYANVDMWWGTNGYGYKENEVLATGYTSQGGDSGGPVVTDYAWDNDRQSWTFDYAGTHTGVATIQGSTFVQDGTYKVYEPIWRTYNDLNMNGIYLVQ